MKKMHVPLVIGNWKMNPQTREKAEALLTEVKKKLGTKNTLSEVVAAPPFMFLSPLVRVVQKSRITLGAQDSFYEPQGAYTGEISLAMLKDCGVSHVIVGHSERRLLGETDKIVALKVAAVLGGGFTAVVCIGETTRDAHGEYFNVVETQLKAVLGSIKNAQLSRLVIAYEPVWAIGTSKHATPEDVQEMKLFIQKVIADTIDRSAVSKVRILYGGSVNKDNAESLLVSGKADGFLVGGASLKASEFVEIVQISDMYGNQRS